MTKPRPKPTTYQCPVCKDRPGATITILVEPHQIPSCSRNGAHKNTQMVVVE